MTLSEKVLMSNCEGNHPPPCRRLNETFGPTRIKISITPSSKPLYVRL